MKDCIFCKIIKREIPGNFVYEDNEIVAFNDIHPKAPVHLLFLPKVHIESLIQVDDSQQDLLGHILLKIVKVMAEMGIEKDGYKVIANNGRGAGQLVLHLHFHVLGGWKTIPKWEV